MTPAPAVAGTNTRSITANMAPALAATEMARRQKEMPPKMVAYLARRFDWVSDVSSRFSSACSRTTAVLILA